MIRSSSASQFTPIGHGPDIIYSIYSASLVAAAAEVGQVSAPVDVCHNRHPAPRPVWSETRAPADVDGLLGNGR
jgi:hypothetical protein